MGSLEAVNHVIEEIINPDLTLPTSATITGLFFTSEGYVDLLQHLTSRLGEYLLSLGDPGSILSHHLDSAAFSAARIVLFSLYAPPIIRQGLIDGYAPVCNRVTTMLAALCIVRYLEGYAIPAASSIRQDREQPRGVSSLWDSVMGLFKQTVARCVRIISQHALDVRSSLLDLASVHLY